MDTARQAFIESLPVEVVERGRITVAELLAVDLYDSASRPSLAEQVAFCREAGIEVVETEFQNELPHRIQPFVSNDNAADYFRSAARYGLLTHEQEVDLAKRYAAGRAAAQLLESDGSSLSHKRQMRLRQVSQRGSSAREELIRSNLRLVISVAKRLAGRDLEFLELIQEGNLGLMHAVEKFDYTKGYKFSTYAVTWIRQYLQRGVANKARTIRVPLDGWLLKSKAARVTVELQVKLGREPTKFELAQALRVPIDRLDSIEAALNAPRSLDQLLSEDSNQSLVDILPDYNAESPADMAIESWSQSRLSSILSELDSRERRVLELRFGFGNDSPQTLEEIAAELEMTREGIRQVQNRALSRLRHPARLSRIIDATTEAPFSSMQ